MADLIQSINDIVNGFVWGVPMMILIVGTGVYFTIRTDFLQIRKFGYAMKNSGLWLAARADKHKSFANDNA